jgi:hypothetical protein
MTRGVLQQHSSAADLHFVRALAKFATNMKKHHRQLFFGQLSRVINGLIDPDLQPMVEIFGLIFVRRLQRRPQEPEPPQSAFFGFLPARQRTTNRRAEAQARDIRQTISNCRLWSAVSPIKTVSTLSSDAAAIDPAVF